MPLLRSFHFDELKHVYLKLIAEEGVQGKGVIEGVMKNEVQVF